MIVDLPNTTTNAINHKLVDLRNSGGAVALGRVLSLVLVTDEILADNAIEIANDASREHPSRVLAIVRGNKRGTARLDAQIRVGGDAGASEVIVLRLYGPLTEHGSSLIVPLLLPDAPIVVWWPGLPPEAPSQDRIGRMATRRITDVAQAKSPIRALMQLAAETAPGDTDLAWSRITRWRALLAAALDQPPFEPVTRAVVTGASDSPSTELLAGWLAFALKCPVTRKKTAPGTGMVAVTLVRPSGKVTIDRPDGNVATLSQPGQPERRIAMPRRSDVECITEELRRLDPDELFADVLTEGLATLHPPRSARAEQETNGAGSPDADGSRSDDAGSDGQEPSWSRAFQVNNGSPSDGLDFMTTSTRKE
jgi:glucose-6-phosphate dehydrogenase assembly protein OpcA